MAYPKNYGRNTNRSSRRNHSNRRMSGNKPMRRQPLRNTRDGDRFYGNNKPVTGNIHDCVKCYSGSSHSCHVCDHFLSTV